MKHKMYNIFPPENSMSRKHGIALMYHLHDVNKKNSFQTYDWIMSYQMEDYIGNIWIDFDLENPSYFVRVSWPQDVEASRITFTSNIVLFRCAFISLCFWLYLFDLLSAMLLLILYQYVFTNKGFYF